MNYTDQLQTVLAVRCDLTLPPRHLQVPGHFWGNGPQLSIQQVPTLHNGFVIYLLAGCGRTGNHTQSEQYGWCNENKSLA